MIMRQISFLLLFSLGFFSVFQSVAQTSPDSVSVKSDTASYAIDTLKVQLDSLTVVSDTVAQVVDTSVFDPIVFTPQAASQYLSKLMGVKDIWRKDNDSLRLSVERLLNHYSEPFDSVSARLQQFKFDSIRVSNARIYQSDTIPLRWLSSTSFMVDTFELEREPLVKEITIIKRIKDTSSFQQNDSISFVFSQMEASQQIQDTTVKTYIDTLYLKSKRVTLHKLTDRGVVPSLVPPRTRKSFRFVSDSSKAIITESIPVLMGNEGSPFYIVPSERMTDSLKYAMETLLDYSTKRDSFLLHINDMAGHKTSLWLSTGKDDLYRYWVKNSKNDSITIWIGNPSRANISLMLEEDVNVERLERKMVDDIPFTTVKANRTLAELKPFKEIPIYWNRDFSTAFSLSQNYLSPYWAKGGESSLTSMLDINGKTEYNNTEAKTKWITTGRLRYGTTWTDEYGFRTNTDIVEVNSQLNKVIVNKLDFSSSFYGKTQVAKGYNNPSDEEVVSKFLNPGTFTIGLGFEYKPQKKTTLNFSPLSYRNTFVLDTVTINQTNHGIEADKRVRHEMGGQLVFKNSMTLLKDMKIDNSLRLFTNYLNNPKNVDVDWELSLEKQISMYFKIKLNLHLIYDDDIHFTILDGNGEPVLLPDGSEKKGPKTQFNQLLGLTFSFNI